MQNKSAQRSPELVAVSASPRSDLYILMLKSAVAKRGQEPSHLTSRAYTLAEGGTGGSVGTCLSRGQQQTFGSAGSRLPVLGKLWQQEQALL